MNNVYEVKWKMVSFGMLPFSFYLIILAHLVKVNTQFLRGESVWQVNLSNMEDIVNVETMREFQRY